MMRLILAATRMAFQSRPDLQGVKTRGRGCCAVRLRPSKADPIFRGSKRLGPINMNLPDPSSKADPIFRGSKLSGRPVTSPNWPSKADPIFRGSKHQPRMTLLASVALPKQTRSSGGQNFLQYFASAGNGIFQSRPDLQGVKTFMIIRGVCFVLPSKADPIFRGSKHRKHRPFSVFRSSKADPIFRGSKHRPGGGLSPPYPSKADPIFRGSKPETTQCKSSNRVFQSRPDLQGVKTTLSASPCHDHIFQSRPDLQGVKTVSRDFLDLGSPSKADPIFRGSNREGPRATSGGPVDAKPIVNE